MSVSGETPSEKHLQKGIFLVIGINPGIVIKIGSGQPWPCTPILPACPAAGRFRQGESSLSSIGRPMRMILCGRELLRLLGDSEAQHVEYAPYCWSA